MLSFLLFQIYISKEDSKNHFALLTQMPPLYHVTYRAGSVAFWQLYVNFPKYVGLDSFHVGDASS